MQYGEALSWLERQGGRWAVHATPPACVVVEASLGSVQVRTLAADLSSECVDAALVETVDRLVRDVDSEAREGCWRPPRAFLG